MTTRTVIVKISPDGSKASTEVQGVKGASCEDVTEALVDALGTVDKSGKTPEYFQEDLSVVNTNV